MPDCVIVRNPDGKLAGLGEKNAKRYSKWRRMVEELDVGETLVFSWKLPRSRRHHGFFFSKLGELFDRQERFPDEDRLLDWLLVGAGHCDLVPGFGGQLVALPRTINWSECDEQTFTEAARGIEEFMWESYAQEFLWPHLAPAARHENVVGWHAQAEENRKQAVARAEARAAAALAAEASKEEKCHT